MNYTKYNPMTKINIVSESGCKRIAREVVEKETEPLWRKLNDLRERIEQIKDEFIVGNGK